MKFKDDANRDVVGFKQSMSSFILKNPNISIDFAQNFYGIKIDRKSKSNFVKFSKVITLRSLGFSKYQIASLTRMSPSTVNKWVYENSVPMVINLLRNYANLGKAPGDTKWLSIDSSRGGLFKGKWITVPCKITKHAEVASVLNQLNNQKSVEHLFAYLLGFMVGDSSKENIVRKERITRRITVRLSKGFLTNEKLGNYVSSCLNTFGLRMKKCKDCPAGKHNTHDFYTWISQSSQFIQWMFHVCLGLKDSEKTTYNKIRMKWMVSSPINFKISFLQGVADSDGFVDVSGFQVGIITHPNTDLIEKILTSLGVKSRRRYFSQNGLWALMISLNDAYALPVFNPAVKSYRYEKMEKLFKADKLSWHMPPWLIQKIDENIRQGVMGTKLVEKILDEFGIRVRTKSINMHVKKLQESKTIALGIESTAL